MWTALPPFVMGIFDQYLNARVMDSYPQLYRLGQRDTFYNNRVFISSIGTTLIHSLIIFYCWKWALGESVVHQNGLGLDVWTYGVMVFATDLVSVTLKGTLMVNSWVSFTAYVLFGSVGAFMIIFPIYAAIFPLFGISAELYSINTRLFTTAVFWFGLLLIPFIVNLRDFAWK